MSTDWRMGVRKDELPPPGWHKAECRKVEDTDTPFGMRAPLAILAPEDRCRGQRMDLYVTIHESTSI
jgi:hypothetical protein